MARVQDAVDPFHTSRSPRADAAPAVGGQGRQLFQHHPVVGYRFIPGLTARVPFENGGYLVRVNRAGFRSNREYVAAQDPGTQRVLLFGDSFTAGNGVANDKRYSDLLETLVPNLEVYNYGLPASGTDQQYLAYREFAQGIPHDLLMVAVFVENIRRNASRYRAWRLTGHMDEAGATAVFPKPYFELVDGELTLRGVPVPGRPIDEAELQPEDRDKIDRGGRFQRWPLSEIRKVVSGMRMTDLCQRITQYEALPEYNSPSSPPWRLMHAILERWVREHHKPVLVVPIPLHQFVEEMSDAGAYRARFREFSQATDCLLHDPLDDLLTYSPPERRAFRFAKDIHLTPTGHLALARSIAPALTRFLGRTQ